jgi:very-short-patch-repair endonuclease
VSESVGLWRHAGAVTLAAELDANALNRLLRDQEQVISRQQALSCGMTPEQLRHKIRRGGPWQRLLPGVYLAVTGRPTRRQYEIAALHCGGGRSVLTGSAALLHHGIRVRESRTIIVLVPAGQARPSRSFVRIWPTTRMPEFVMADGAIRLALAARAVTDAARELTSFRDVRAVTADAVQRRRCRLDELTGELAHAPVRHSAWLRRALAEVADGVRSVAEGDLRTLIRTAGLPAPVFNARLYVGRTLLAVADAWWPDAGVVVEVDSREWHLSPEDWQRTLRRHASLSAHGIIVLHVTPQQIRTEAGRVAADIRAALQSGRARPMPGLRTLSASS